MAEAIEYAHQPPNEKQESCRDLRHAPGEYAGAILDGYAVLQLLREKGILEMIKDGLGSMEKALEIITETLERDEVVRTVRNLAILVKTLGSIEPDTLENIMESVSRATAGSTAGKPPALLSLLSQLSSQDTRRALQPLAAALQAAGRSIPRTPKEERSHTTRHSA
ncbi:MAG: hypothetical protein ACREE6_11940 [Limisphaerales bacterium]